MKKFTQYLIATLFVFTISSCALFEVEEFTDPNNPSVNVLQSGATRDQVNQLAIGIFSSLRSGLYRYTVNTGTFGREIYELATNDSRSYNQLLGREALDNTNFLNSYWADFNVQRRRANDFRVIANISASLTEQERRAVSGFCYTAMAFSMLHNLNIQGSNGIRIDLEDPFNPGPFVSYDAALAEIKRLNDLGAADLAAGGSAFPFEAPVGFSGFDTPATFRQFNRALAARIAVYQEDWNGALDALDDSFLDLDGDLMIGPFHTYGASPDVLNPFFDPAQSTAAAVVFANPSYLNDMEDGDDRANKVRLRDVPRVLGQPPITGTHELALYSTSTSTVSIIRNEELILLFAEASIQVQGDNAADGIAAINYIRNEHNLPDYSGATTQVALLDEMLNQKRYSLWFEGGHRWIDMRRYNKFDELPLDDAGDEILDKMPRPFAEIAWDEANGN